MLCTKGVLTKGHSPFHDRANVDAAIASLVTLAHDGDAQKVNRVHVERDGNDVEGHGRVRNAREGGGSRWKRRQPGSAPLRTTVPPLAWHARMICGTTQTIRHHHHRCDDKRHGSAIYFTCRRGDPGLCILLRVHKARGFQVGADHGRRFVLMPHGIVPVPSRLNWNLNRNNLLSMNFTYHASSNIAQGLGWIPKLRIWNKGKSTSANV